MIERRPLVANRVRRIEGSFAFIAYSRPSRPVIPREAGHPFHFIPATNSI